MLDLATLKATLQPIRSVGEVEERFMIRDIEVCMRVLSPKEELEIQRWAQQNIITASEAERENDNSLAVEYLNRFKLGCVARSVVEINGVDLRNEEFVTTGEVLANGKPVKVKRVEAIVELIEGWPRPLLTAVFRKFNEIMERCELQSDKSIEFNPPDIDSEIQQLLSRLQTLEEMKKGKENAQAIAGDFPTEAPVDAPVDTPQKVAPEKTAAATTPTSTGSATLQPRRSVLPNAAAPIEKEQEQAEADVPETVSGGELFESSEVVTTAAGSVGSAAAQDGWVDRTDADAMQSAVAAETMRIQELRNKRTVKEPVNEGTQDGEPSINPRFVPPTKR